MQMAPSSPTASRLRLASPADDVPTATELLAVRS